MSFVEKVVMAPEGPSFSKLIQGYWRLDSWGMSKQARLTFMKQHVELGITTIDTAAIYKNSETLLGEALKLDPGIRDKIQIISKFGINSIPDSPSEKRVSHYDSSKSAILTSVDNSLRQLGVEQLDALLIHRPDFLMVADQVQAAFTELENSGKVAHFGVSNFTPMQFDLLQSRLSRPLITNQVELNPINLDSLENGVLEQLQKDRVRPMAWSCLAGGAVFNKTNVRIARLRTTLEEVAKEIGATSITQVIFAWILKHPSKPVALIGSGKIKRVQDPVAALRLNMNTEQWYRILVASKGQPVP
ncbi:aldo/keto reductase [Psychromonas sp. 14N.309.X.WAT.B.A12]|uniref:aldo/keto reductase n=1 Tax=Psychromonas sp. 14N.309.X.WAT.B.A12 TaxID=2998322 RepID=UPI0025B214F8|nr:aldo/keto reductase [Psychromonas sp. 14N.309.X.WAT.B.A12]MDN2664341.1 aldo/keto reductase [Psychromonas sp. 14N.309.X.WAT.B.A12]